MVRWDWYRVEVESLWESEGERCRKHMLICPCLHLKLFFSRDTFGEDIVFFLELLLKCLVAKDEYPASSNWIRISPFSYSDIGNKYDWEVKRVFLCFLNNNLPFDSKNLRLVSKFYFDSRWNLMYASLSHLLKWINKYISITVEIRYKQNSVIF